MNILVAGGTGFVGQALVKRLVNRGDHTFILTRSPHKHTNNHLITYLDYSIHPASLPMIDAVINLAGDSLFGYWTEKKKHSIQTSRMQVTKKLIDLITPLKHKPEVFINASAIGYYGTSEERIFTEHTITPGNDFLAKVATTWEKEASRAHTLDIRTVYVRFGVILERNGGALPLMSMPVKLFAGGKIGHGEQWISWIHLHDVINMLMFTLDHKHISGPINATAPYPQRNKDFMKTLSATLQRPCWLPAPAPIMRITLGEMSELITKGQYVLPKRIQSYGYSFTFPKLEVALKAILQ